MATAALLLGGSGAAAAATYNVTAGSNYFGQHRFGTYAGTTGAATTTGQVAVGFGPTFTVTHIGGTPGTGTGEVRAFAPGNLPAGSGFPSPVPGMNEVVYTHLGGVGQAAPGGGIRYEFTSALPLGTHVYLQDIDASEVVQMRFFACGTNTPVDPGAFDYLVASTTGTPSAVFGTGEVTLTAASTAGVNENEPLVAVVVRDPGVCRIEYRGTYVATTSWQTYFSVPPTDPGIVKSLAVPSPLIAGGPVSWTLTLTNHTPAPIPISPALANPTQAYGLVISDAVHPGITGLTATITDAGGTVGGACIVGAGNAVSCSGFSPLAPGNSIVVTLSGTLGAGVTGNSLPNTATLSSAGPNDPDPSNNTSTTDTPIAWPITLSKAWSGARAGDAVGLVIAGAGVSDATDGSSIAPATTVAASAHAIGGSVVDLSEAFTVGSEAAYATELTCTKAPGGDPVAVTVGGSSRSIAMPGDGAVTCVFANDGREADLRVVKAGSPGTVLPGGVIAYTITVDNLGPADAVDVLLSDDADARLDCTVPSPLAACSALGGAVCPGNSASVPVADLVGGGAVIPLLPAGGQVVVTMQCTVNATGLP